MRSGQILVDSIYQIGELVRIDISNTFLVGETLVSLEVEPEAAAGFINVPIVDKRKWFLDWAYDSAGAKVIILRVTTDLGSQNFTVNTDIVTLASDHLFSLDTDLLSFESDIMKWLPVGRSSYNNVTRKVQDLILNELYKEQILSTTKEKLTKVDVIDVSEVKFWSTFWVLELIFGSINNQKDDVFAAKASKYGKLRFQYAEQSKNLLKIDYNKDGALTDVDYKQFRSVTLNRR